MKLSRIALTGGLLCLSISPFLCAQEEEPLQVVVTADRKARTIDETLAPVTVLTRASIERYQASDIPDLLRHVPGISLTNDGGMGKNSSVVVRGTNASHVLVLIDGVKVGSATVGSIAWADLPLAEVERIEVVRGPRSSLYGSEAIGGVIQIFTRKGGKGTQPEVSISAGSHNTYKTSANLSGGNNTTWYNLNVGREQTDGINACTSSSGCFTVEPDKDGYERNQLAVRAGHRFVNGTETEVSALHAEGTNQFDGSFNNETDFAQQVISAKVRHPLGDKTLLTAQIGQSRDEADNALNGKPLAAYRTYNTQRNTASVQMDRSMGQHGSVSIGMDQQQDKIGSDSAYTRQSRDNTGVFASYQTTVGKNSLDIAARQDDNEQFGTHATGSIALGRDLAGDKRITLAYGTAFKAATFNDLYYPYSGNPDLKPESSRNLEIGMQGKAGKGKVQWVVNAFHNQIDDLIAWQDTGEGVWLPSNVNQARIQGVEANAQTQVAGWDVNANMSVQKPENRSGLDAGNRLVYRPEQLANVDVDRTLGKWRVGATVRGEGKRYTNSANTDSLPGYATVDLRADYRLAKSWTVGAKIGNVLDKQYETNRGYNQDGINSLVTVKYAPK